MDVFDNQSIGGNIAGWVDGWMDGAMNKRHDHHHSHYATNTSFTLTPPPPPLLQFLNSPVLLKPSIESLPDQTVTFHYHDNTADVSQVSTTNNLDLTARYQYIGVDLSFNPNLVINYLGASFLIEIISLK